MTARAIRVLVGSETGNADMVADRLVAAARESGAEVVRGDLNTAVDEDLTAYGALLVVASTTGDGEMPYLGLKFWKQLSATDRADLNGLPFAVLGLGDTAYYDFCQAAVDLDQRFGELGGERLLEVCKLDDVFEDGAAEWIGRILPIVLDRLGLGGPAVERVVASAGSEAESTPHARWNRLHPFMATVHSNDALTPLGAPRTVRHVEIDVAGWDQGYRPGDALGIVPVNDPALVDALLVHLGESGDRDIDGRTLRLVLSEDLEISRPGRDLVEHVATLIDDPGLRALLRGVDRAALRDYLFDRDVLDLIELAGPNGIATDTLLGLLPPLAHRSYSIASSALVAPDRIALTVAVLRFSSHGRRRGGVCSTHLEDRLAPGESVKVFLVPNEHFQPPADDAAPIVMIGPGTGVAPFRGFLHERRARGATGSNWLFFGNRHRGGDFLYGEEFEAMAADGLLTRLDLAFSRDQVEKIYVQHRMRERGAELYAWLSGGASLFVCGDESSMAGDVDEALHEIVATHGGMSADAAAGYVDELRVSGRYVRDVY